MLPEELPQGIMVVERDPFYHTYRLDCLCCDPNDSFTFDIDLDKELNEINLTVFATLYTKYPIYHKNWILEKIFNFKQRVSIAVKVLLMGYYEVFGGFTFKGDNQFDNFLIALQWSRKEISQSGKIYGQEQN